jgi:hypothetical protein
VTDLDDRTIAILAGRPAKSVTACARQPRLEKLPAARQWTIAQVSSGSNALVSRSADEFRYTPNIGHIDAPPSVTLCANKRLMHGSKL